MAKQKKPVDELAEALDLMSSKNDVMAYCDCCGNVQKWVLFYFGGDDHETAYYCGGCNQQTQIRTGTTPRRSMVESRADLITRSYKQMLKTALRGSKGQKCNQ